MTQIDASGGGAGNGRGRATAATAATTTTVTAAAAMDDGAATDAMEAEVSARSTDSTDFYVDDVEVARRGGKY